MAIKESPDRMLTLNGIYNYLQQKWVIMIVQLDPLNGAMIMLMMRILFCYGCYVSHPLDAQEKRLAIILNTLLTVDFFYSLPGSISSADHMWAGRIPSDTTCLSTNASRRCPRAKDSASLAKDITGRSKRNPSTCSKTRRANGDDRGATGRRWSLRIRQTSTRSTRAVLRTISQTLRICLPIHIPMLPNTTTAQHLLRQQRLPLSPGTMWTNTRRFTPRRTVQCRRTTTIHRFPRLPWITTLTCRTPITTIIQPHRLRIRIITSSITDTLPIRVQSPPMGVLKVDRNRIFV